MDCARQDYRYPGDSATLAEHFERFADDQDAWIEEFFPAFEKMLALNSNAKELAQRQDDLLDWYHGYMRSLCGTFERELASVMAGTLKLDAHWSA